MLPLLKYAGDGEEHSLRETIEALRSSMSAMLRTNSTFSSDAKQNSFVPMALGTGMAVLMTIIHMIALVGLANTLPRLSV